METRFARRSARQLIAACSMVGFTVSASAYAPDAATRIGEGEVIAATLHRQFNDTRTFCAGGQPAFECNGIVLRTGSGTRAYHGWNPNPAKPFVSFSWIRRDTATVEIFNSQYAGMILWPTERSRALGLADLDVSCAFPFDGDSDHRGPDGCGEMTVPGYPGTRPCDEEGIFTATEWMLKYPGPWTLHARWSNQCGFVTARDKPQRAVAFAQIAPIMGLLPPPDVDPRLTYNELVVKAWPQDIHQTVPVMAFFHLKAPDTWPGDDPLERARFDQCDMFRVSGRWLPVIAVQLPSARGDDASFAFRPGEQMSPDRCVMD